MKIPLHMNNLACSTTIVWVAVIGSLCVIIPGGCNQNGPNTMVSKFNPKPLKIPIPWHDSFAAATEEANLNGKPILANFTGSDWCHWCVKLKNDVYETEHFADWAKQNVILVNLDYPRRSTQSQVIRDQNQELKQRYAIDGYPTVLLLDSSGNVLGKLGYGKDPVEWTAKADEILRSATR